VSSPTQGVWECRHGVDARDWCDQCCPDDDLRARLEIAEATNHVLTELIYELLGGTR
jgi:hypothetical protein